MNIMKKSSANGSTVGSKNDPLDDDTPFSQSDEDFMLDLRRNPTHAQLAETISRSGHDSETAEFLRGFMVDHRLEEFN